MGALTLRYAMIFCMIVISGSPITERLVVLQRPR